MDAGLVSLRNSQEIIYIFTAVGSFIVPPVNPLVMFSGCLWEELDGITAATELLQKEEKSSISV